MIDCRNLDFFKVEFLVSLSLNSGTEAAIDFRYDLLRSFLPISVIIVRANFL